MMNILHIVPSLMIWAFLLDIARETSGTTVSYEDLMKMNATCPGYKTCPEEGSIYLSKCNCGTSCAQLGTCCLDSSGILLPVPQVKPTCRVIKTSTNYTSTGTGYFMVDVCPQSNKTKGIFDELCEEEWEGQNDIMRIVPVTSAFTHITYKNYFCFRCHESNVDHLFWNIRVTYESESKMEAENKKTQLAYNRFFGTWLVPVGKGNYVPVNLRITRPVSVYPITKQCIPRLTTLIADCSEDWQDEEVRSKCEAYMYVTNIAKDNGTLEYRNPHCALCNFESLDNLDCPVLPTLSYDQDVPKQKPFSFTFLLDINRSDGDKVGKIQRCNGDELWDPFFKKCRVLKCARKDYIVQEGKCVPP